MSTRPTQWQPLAFVRQWLHERSDLSLRWLLAGSFSVLLLTMVVLGVVAITSERQTIAALKQILVVDVGSTELTASATQAVVRARRYEKDFLLNQNEFGFAEAKQRYLTLFRAKLVDARSRLTALLKLSPDARTTADVAKIITALDNYEHNFIEVVMLYERRGYIDTGLEGVFRAKAHEMENLIVPLPVPALQIDLGEIRRREKDFVTRGRDIDNRLLLKAVDRFKKDLATATLSLTQRSALQSLADDYRASFEQFVQTSHLIDSRKRSYLANIQSIEPGLESVAREAHNKSSRSRERIIANEKRIEALILATNIFGILGSILMTLLVYRKITRAVNETTIFARRIAENEVTTRIKTSGKHEFGKLDVALNQMADALLAARIEQEKKSFELFERNASLASEVAMRVLAQAALVEANRVLEKRVADRTMALRESNESLRKDIVARAEAERALAESEERFHHLADLSSDWYWEQDENFRFTMMSRSAGTINGDVLNQCIGKTRWEMPIVMSESGWAEHKDLLAKHQTFSDFEYKVDFADKKLRWFSASGEPVFDSNGVFKGYRGTGKDISERKRSEEQIQHMALHDALTGLPNRTLLQDRIAHAIAVANRQSHALWVLFIDLDRFKFINDSLGHKAGDVLLMTIAQRLQTTLREHDTVARIGGDEFVLVLPDLAASPLTARVIQRILDAVSEPMLLEGQQIVIGCSIGIAIYPMDGVDEERLLEHADTAMYRAKKNGRNNFQFYTALMNDGASERLSIENGLRHALANEELVLHYQPQVDLLTNKIVGVEALIRWQHPTLGLIAPGRFISIAEETGLIIPIGAWVLRTACAQNKAWHRAGHDNLRIAVNVSARQFADPALVQTIVDALANNELAAHHLDIEITESLLMTDVEQALGILLELTNLGVHLSIDDFGTGYSSLTYLKQFPINALKIDQSFVHDISVDKTSEAIVTSIISLAHNLQIQVIAEGVENQAQLDFLRQQQCGQMQGYYFSRPVPVADLEAMLHHGCMMKS